jgi:hypothetical protein
VAKLVPFHVRYPIELRSLSVLPLKRKPGVGSVVIADPALPQDKRQSWERQINRHLRACACAESGLGLLLALIGIALYLVWRWSAGGELGWSTLGWSALVAFLCALFGKWVGLVRAEMRYRDLVRRIAEEWPAQPPKARQVNRCG